jgi:hydroxyethylthiazole kinase-like uncharacterized protein yjeF
MRGVWPTAELRAVEAEALAATRPDELMQRAAAAVATTAARWLRRHSGGVYGRRVLVVAGAGHNGGDALFAGARLADAGAQVSAVLLDPARAHAAGVAALLASGARLVDDEPDAPAAAAAAADLAIDGIVGLGGAGALRPAAAAVVAALHERAVPIVAVDAPSGVDLDSGAVAGAAVRAATTVTFGGLKPGLLIGPGREHAGVVRLVELGFDRYLPEPALRVLEQADVARLLPEPGPRSDKYSRGVVGLVSGSEQYAGAAVLSVGAAVHSGAGLVRYAGAAPDAVRARWPEVIVHPGVAEAGRVQAWVVGPGLGTDDAAADALDAVLATDRPVLVDADGITLLGTDRFAGRLPDRTAPTVLTPHDREFERVFGPVGDDRWAAVRRAAADSGSTVLLKGNATLVSGPDGRGYVNPTGTPWLATAGTGDVLSGVIGVLLAAGLEPALAAAAGAFWHGAAGQLAAAAGPPSAGDVLAALRPSRPR